MNINDKVLTDLEIYNKIIPKIDFTITSFGTDKLKSIIKRYSFNENLLRQRNVIKGIISGPRSMRFKINRLKNIKKLEFCV